MYLICRFDVKNYVFIVVKFFMNFFNWEVFEYMNIDFCVIWFKKIFFRII